MVGKLCKALRVVERGPKGIVLATASLWDDLEEVRLSLERKLTLDEAKRKAASRYEKGVRHCRTHMATSAATGFELVARLGGLVQEGRHPSGMSTVPEVLVCAFKHDQYRCYGSRLTYGPIPCFVLIEADESKKNNKADQTLLKRVAKEVGKLADEASRNPLAVTDVWPPRREGE